MKRTLVYAALLTGLCIALALVSVSLTGCSTVAKTLNIENPRYSLHDIRPRIDIALPLSASAIDFDFALGVENPNSVGLRLDRIDFDLLVNDNPVINSVSSQGVRIPARGSGDVRLRARVGYNNIRTIWREVADVIQGNRARYSLRGNAYYDTPLGQMRFPVTVYSTN
jgi:LEA14-like dessication related protein